MAEISNLVVGILVFVVFNLIYAMIGLIIFMRWYKRRQKNRIDITILELTKNGVVARHEIGRREQIKNQGEAIVTIKPFSINKVKDNLGYHISDDDMVHSGHGKNRQYLIIAKKDKLSVPLEYLEISEEFTPEEKIALESIAKKLNTPEPIKLTTIPKTLNLSPIKKEQLRFMMDITGDMVEVEGLDEKKMARRMVLIAAGIFALSIIVGLVIFIIVLNQSPDVAAKIAQNTAEATITTIPGVSV